MRICIRVSGYEELKAHGWTDREIRDRLRDEAEALLRARIEDILWELEDDDNED